MVIGVSSLQAQVQYLSDDRHVNVSALAGAFDGNVSYSDSDTADPFLDFHGNVNVVAEWTDTTPGPGPGGQPRHTGASSTSTQDSTFLPNQLHFESHVAVSTFGSFSGPTFEVADADAVSFFQMSLSVSEPVTFNLSLLAFRHIGVAAYNELFDLTDGSGSILGPPIIQDDGTLVYTGLLQPGEVYTLLVSQHLHLNVPDPLGQDAFSNFHVNMTFSGVPEPSSVALVVLGTLLTLGARGLKSGRLYPAAKRVAGNFLPQRLG